MTPPKPKKQLVLLCSSVLYIEKIIMNVDNTLKAENT